VCVGAWETDGMKVRSPGACLVFRLPWCPCGPAPARVSEPWRASASPLGRTMATGPGQMKTSEVGVEYCDFFQLEGQWYDLRPVHARDLHMKATSLPYKVPQLPRLRPRSFVERMPPCAQPMQYKQAHRMYYLNNVRIKESRGSTFVDADTWVDIGPMSDPHHLAALLVRGLQANRSSEGFPPAQFQGVLPYDLGDALEWVPVPVETSEEDRIKVWLAGLEQARGFVRSDEKKIVWQWANLRSKTGYKHSYSDFLDYVGAACCDFSGSATPPAAWRQMSPRARCSFCFEALQWPDADGGKDFNPRALSVDCLAAAPGGGDHSDDRYLTVKCWECNHRARGPHSTAVDPRSGLTVAASMAVSQAVYGEASAVLDEMGFY